MIFNVSYSIALNENTYEIFKSKRGPCTVNRRGYENASGVLSLRSRMNLKEISCHNQAESAGRIPEWVQPVKLLKRHVRSHLKSWPPRTKDKLQVTNGAPPFTARRGWIVNCKVSR
ncbi:hypothetical protein GWI33_006144 [Rhynchophorus ferrugineus]|uniref:Uncharacterized protein n=1 Tax=Rhynchophorus ferrugineus TaxID=354439 RepID=A0A834IJI3_RHYFE|nr:hypothetical protein GWI33_006144 [Rhynchophorus ferrugineus]